MRVESLREFLMKGAVLVVQMTPFTRDDEVDVEGLRENTRYLISVSRGRPLALVPCGSNGEFYAMKEDEIKKVIKVVVDEAGGKVPVIAGTGAAGTKIAVELSKYSQDVGADGVQVVLPYYHVPDEEGMYLHYKKIAEAVDIGVMIYNNPSVSKAYVRPTLMRKLAEIPNIVGVKENTPFIDVFYQQVKAVGHKIPIVQGRGEWWYAATLPYGARGFVSGLANFMPEFSLELLKAGSEGDWKKVHELIRRLEPLDEFIAKMREKYGPSTSVLQPPYTTSYIYMSVRKAAMDLIGLRGGRMRLPLVDLKDEDKAELEKVLFEKLGLQRVK
ncbi:MAG: dihydrodipicolinate synthase family protein [Sulfolobales archaeon]